MTTFSIFWEKSAAAWSDTITAPVRKFLCNKLHEIETSLIVSLAIFKHIKGTLFNWLIRRKGHISFSAN